MPRRLLIEAERILQGAVGFEEAADVPKAVRLGGEARGYLPESARSVTSCLSSEARGERPSPAAQRALSSR